jgi:MSHA pilin protein MshC
VNFHTFHGQNSDGFTLVELIVVLIIAGAIAVVAIPRLMGPTEFEAMGFYDSAQATVRYAQKVAIAQRRPVFVVIDPSQVRLCYDGGCAAAVTDPLRNQPFSTQAPGGIALAGSSFSFDGLGRPSSSATISVTSSDGTRNFFVEAETGYVHP